ncbi:RNA 2',3'-cyclic phosphodiesterase [Nitrincola sp. MINF-07-Sa-05]|uniref:RNA 2',3'-cyclic phosphodiesterase n=1 Tax=Nitrincola salilacus TaxID=3400273 RepID=UPI0039186386
MSHSRLFFALPCPADQTRLITQWREQHLADTCSALTRTSAPSWIPKANFHITLIFLGQVAHEQQVELINAANQLSLPAFDLELTHCGNWPRSGILWLAPKRTPEPLQQLVTELKQMVAPIDVLQDTRNYHPHLTLARHANTPMETIKLEQPFTLQARAFGLYRSVDTPAGIEYHALKRWRLKTGAA